jgi:serine protease AprX
MRPCVALCSTLLVALLSSSTSAQTSALLKLDPLLQQRAANPVGRSPIIVQPLNASVDFLIQALGGNLGRALPIINARVADIADTALTTLANDPAIDRLSLDRPTSGSMDRTAATIGATSVRAELGLDGRGIGIALIDSGVLASHDDLTDGGLLGSPRVVGFVDFVNGRTDPYDDYGHGTHVAGIVAGNGFDSDGARAGVAPAAQLVMLKVLDGTGAGRISNVIAALDYVVENRNAFNIRIANLSVGAGVYESYDSDVLAQAAKRAVLEGILVVAAAGNNGRDSLGRTLSGGVTAPGNAPWVLTVGASSHMGTVDRSDDVVAPFSSRGPTSIDRTAKPDLVAPGVGTESLSVPNSRLSSIYSAYLLNGTVATAYPPYLSLTGTSMSAPVVTGTAALMLQVNPALTPNAIKAILQYTAQVYAGYDLVTQGAGFLNARGAVELARYFANPWSGSYPTDVQWSHHIIWGTHLLQTGRILPDVNAWALSTVWGTATVPGDNSVAWGQVCTAACSPDGSGTWTVWATASDGDTVVWGTSGDGDTVVWGTTDGDTVVWGTDCAGGGCDPVLWPR